MTDVVGLRYVQEGLPEVLQGQQQYQKSTNATVQGMKVAVNQTNQNAKSLDRLTRDAVKAENEMRRLAQALQRGAIQSGQFQGEVNRIAARLRALGLDRAQSETLRYARAQATLARETEQAGNAIVQQGAQIQTAMRGQAAATMFASRAQNASGMAVQQVGYQVGDFLVQVQSGTNAMVAFGQQATQLVGVLPMFGSILGVSGTALIGLSAGLGIAIPLVTAIGATIMRARENAGDAEAAFKGLGDTLGRLDDVRLDNLNKGIAEGARDAAREYERVLNLMERVELRALQSILRGQSRAVEEMIKNQRTLQNLAAQTDTDFDFEVLGLGSFNEAIFLAAQLRTLTGETREELLQQVTAIEEALTLRGLMNPQVEALIAKLAEEVGLAEAARDAVEAQNEALRAGADASAAHVAAYREDQIAAAEAVADQQAALLEENTRFEEEQARKRAVAQAKGDASRIAAINLYYDNLEKAEAERERVEAARAQIRKQRAEEEAALQKAMNQQVADQQAALLEENARYERASRAQVENFNAQKLSLQEQLALTQKIALYGRDSAEVRALQLEQEIAARKRSIDAQVAENRLSAEHGSLIKALVEELLRAEAAAEGTKSEVAGIGPALQSAIDQANAFASAMGRARAESAGIGISTAGLQAQAAALESGASRAEATAKGAAATLRERLIADAGGTVGRGTGMRIEQQVAERFDAVLQRELAQERVRALTATPSGGGGGGGGGAAREQEDYLAGLLAEAEQKRRLVGLDEEETRRREILFELQKRDLSLNDARIEQIIKTEAETRKLIEAERQREQLMQTIEGNIKSAFMTMVDGSASVEDAFRNMLRNIILAIYEQKVAQPAATALGSLFDTAIGSLFGPGTTTGTPLTIPSTGVDSLLPSFDGGGFTGYGPRSGGMDGRGGFPAMLHPRETVIDHAKGQATGSVTVNQYFSIAANGDDSVRRIVRQEAPRIAEQAKAAVVDAKRRGGSYGRSF